MIYNPALGGVVWQRFSTSQKPEGLDRHLAAEHPRLTFVPNHVVSRDTAPIHHYPVIITCAINYNVLAIQWVLRILRL